MTLTLTALVIVLIACALAPNAAGCLLQDVAHQLQTIRETLEELTK